MPRIAFFNRSYWPDAEATGQLLQELCESLVPEWDVTVVAGKPNKNVSDVDYNVGSSQSHNGVQIERLRHTTFRKSSKLGRIVNFVTFTYQVWRWGHSNKSQFDVIVNETDPFLLPIIVSRIAKSRRAKYVAYVQDIFPDIPVEMELTKENVITRFLRQRIKNAYLSADCVIVLDEDMRERLMSWGIPRDQFVILPNWIDTTNIRPMQSPTHFRQKLNCDDKFVVMHSGNMGLSQGLTKILQTAKHPNWPENVQLVFVGDGIQRQELEEYAKANEIDSVVFYDYQPKEQISDSFGAADLHIISMDTRMRGCIAPSKLYSIMAAGKPVLAIGPPNCAMSKYVEDMRIGLSATFGSDDEIIAKIIWIISHPQERQRMSRTSRELAIKEFDRGVACQRVAKMLRDLLES